METLQGALQEGDLVMYQNNLSDPFSTEEMVWLGIVQRACEEPYADRMLVMFLFDVTASRQIHKQTSEPREGYEKGRVYRLATFWDPSVLTSALPREDEHDV